MSDRAGTVSAGSPQAKADERGSAPRAGHAGAGEESEGAPASPDQARETAILATLVYHDLLDLPLTAVECWRYLLRSRLTGTPDAEAPTLRDVDSALAVLVLERTITTREGFFVLPGRVSLVDERSARHAQSQQKWKRLRRIAFWLQVVPFLRGIAGTGSLAFENAKESSDLDVLVIAAPNRVWTVRFLLTMLLDVFRLRRRPSGPTRDRICLNHYLALDALEFPYRSLYTAMEYARLIPILGEETCRRFRSANRGWMLNTLVRVLPDTLRHQKTIRPSRMLRSLQGGAELLFLGPVGAAIERFLARLQHARIARAEATTAPGGRVVATEARAEFHPHSREAPLLEAFNLRMEDLGLAADFGNQKDSGLTL